MAVTRLFVLRIVGLSREGGYRPGAAEHLEPQRPGRGRAGFYQATLQASVEEALTFPTEFDCVRPPGRALGVFPGVVQQSLYLSPEMHGQSHGTLANSGR